MPKKRKLRGKPKSSGRRGRAKKGAGGLSKTVSRIKGGTEDVEDVTLVWEYIISTAIAANSDATYAFKGNSIYRPGGIASIGLGLTTNPVGYARLFSQYRLAVVKSSSMQVSAWASSGAITGGVPTAATMSVPLRVAIVPATSFAVVTYAAQNTASIGGYPHSTQSFGNNTVRCKSHGSNSLLLTAGGKVDSSSGVYSSTTGADPALMWNYCLGIGNGSTALNATTLEARVRITYKCRFYEPVAHDVEMATVDRFGGEYDVGFHGSDAKSEVKAPRAAAESMSLQFSQDVGPESDDPDEILFRKMLAARLGTVVPRRGAILSSVAGAPGAGAGFGAGVLKATEPLEWKVTQDNKKS